MIVARALYGPKIYGDAWRAKLAETLKSLGYKSSEVDANVRMKRDFQTNRDPYYKYMLCYVDDLTDIYFNPKEDMYDLNLIYHLKGGFGPHHQYLCDNIEKVELDYG